MSFAPDIDGLDIDLTKCHECEHYKSTAVFDLCMHAQSRYSIAGKVDFHTISHMRANGPCRREATLFSPVAFSKTRPTRPQEIK
jgi:hypothetical protein